MAAAWLQKADSDGFFFFSGVKLPPVAFSDEEKTDFLALFFF